MSEPQQAFRAAISSIVVALRTGALRASAFPMDARSQPEVDRRRVLIPARFWRGLMDYEIVGIMRAAEQRHKDLDAGMCIRLWECLRRKGQPPRMLGIALHHDDLKKLFPDYGSSGPPPPPVGSRP